MTSEIISMLYHNALVEGSQTLQVLRPALHLLVKSLPAASSIALLCYMAAVRRCRFRGIKALLDKYPDPTTPLRDINVAHEVYSRTFLLDFPFIAAISLEMTGLKTFAIPSISKVLVATKQVRGALANSRYRSIMLRMHRHSSKFSTLIISAPPYRVSR